MSSSSPASPPANSSHSGKNEPEQAPRAPHDITLSRLANGNAGNQNHYQETSNGNANEVSNLSALAKEFVPKSDPSCIPSLKKEKKLSASAKEFVPRYIHMVSDEDLSQYSSFAQLSMCPAHLSSSNSLSENPVDAFKTAIFHLRTQPGNLDDYMKPVADLLERKYVDTYLLNEIVEILFEESITVPNFRYTGARICKYLSQLEKIGVEFRTVLLKRCQKEHSEKEKLISDEKTIPRLCGFSLFLAELFLLLEVEITGISEKYAPLRNALHSLLELLLKNSNNQTVKCATQLMKLAGATIEETKLLENKTQQSFADIYEMLSELKESPKLDKTSHLLINSVLNLKAKNFDCVESAAQPNVSASPAAAELAAAMAATDLPNEPVFFNEKGQQISRVEAGYSLEDDLSLLIEEVDLDAADQLDEEYYDEGEQSYVESVDVMDDEMMRCYEEFLRDTEK